MLVDGCFWQGCPDHHAQPATNSRYWADKIARNVERDIVTTECLQQTGWDGAAVLGAPVSRGCGRPVAGRRAAGVTVGDPLSCPCGTSHADTADRIRMGVSAIAASTAACGGSRTLPLRRSECHRVSLAWNRK